MSYDLLQSVSGYVPPSRARVKWEAHSLKFGPSPFTGAMQTKPQWGMWTAQFTWEEIEDFEAQPLLAFFDTKAALGTPFTICDPARLAPRLGGSAINNSGQVLTAPGVNTRQIVTKWSSAIPEGNAKLLSAGDLITTATKQECYQLAKDVLVADRDSVTLDLVQAIRTPPNVDEYLIVVNPFMRVVVQASASPDTYAPARYGIQVDMLEDLSLAT